MVERAKVKLIYGMTLETKKRLKFPVKGVEAEIYSPMGKEYLNYAGGCLFIEFDKPIDYLDNPECWGIRTSTIESVEIKNDEFRVYTLNSKYVFKIKEKEEEIEQ